MLETARLKLSLLFTERGQQLAVLLAVVGVCSLAIAGVVVATPETTASPVDENEQQFATALNTSAVVTGNTTLWPAGTRLWDKPVYVSAATPTLDLHANTTVPADEQVTVETRISLRYRATADGETVWERTVTLADREVTVTNGTALTTTTLDTDRVRERASNYQQEFGRAGDVQVHLRVETSYESTAYTGDLNASSRVEFTDRGYGMTESMADGHSRSTTEMHEETVPPNPLVYGGFGLLGLCSLIGAGLLVVTTREDIGPAVGPDRDSETLREELRHVRYDEWISAGRLAPSTGERRVELATLADLVDLAIDSNERVVHDDSRGLYGVLSGTTLYVYHDDTGGSDGTVTRTADVYDDPTADAHGDPSDDDSQFDFGVDAAESSTADDDADR
ncbi:DUF5305 family protein [Salinirubrum litoreum]|uniref:DUF5305 family protein n=1 Tax=Salinirubrum litoreum TaxID=1126234 RepID=A0ABD5R6S0_9EURY|nr:DUF5305 family protein [Salinirubrum litoreum]